MDYAIQLYRPDRTYPTQHGIQREFAIAWKQLRAKGATNNLRCESKRIVVGFGTDTFVPPGTLYTLYAST